MGQERRNSRPVFWTQGRGSTMNAHATSNDENVIRLSNIIVPQLRGEPCIDVMAALANVIVHVAMHACNNDPELAKKLIRDLANQTTFGIDAHISGGADVMGTA